MPMQENWLDDPAFADLSPEMKERLTGVANTQLGEVESQIVQHRTRADEAETLVGQYQTLQRRTPELWGEENYLPITEKMKGLSRDQIEAALDAARQPATTDPALPDLDQQWEADQRDIADFSLKLQHGEWDEEAAKRVLPKMGNTIQYLSSALSESQSEIEKVRGEFKNELEGFKQQVGQGLNVAQNQAWTSAVLGKQVAEFARKHPDRDVDKVWGHMVEKRVPWEQAEAEVYGAENHKSEIEAAARKIIEEQGYVKPGETETGQPNSPEGLGESFGQRTWHRPNKPSDKEVLVGEDAFLAKVNERLEKEFGAAV